MRTILPIALASGLLSQACSDNLTPQPEDRRAPSFDCLPNLDGVLESSEMPTLLDTPQDFLVARNQNLSLVAETLELRQELSGEEKRSLSARSVGDFWFRDSFAPESIVFPLDGEAENYAVLHRGEASVELLGIASAEEDQTLLLYQAPVYLFRFPMRAGDSWVSESAVGGQFEGLAYSAVDRYEVAVEGPVAVELPHLAFDDGYRIRTRVQTELDSSGVQTERQQLLVVSECFGEVLRANSRDGETNTNFEDIDELWRFSL